MLLVLRVLFVLLVLLVAAGLLLGLLELVLVGGAAEPELLAVGVGLSPAVVELSFVVSELGALILGCSCRMPALYTMSVPRIKMPMIGFFMRTTIRHNAVYLLTARGQEVA